MKYFQSFKNFGGVNSDLLELFGASFRFGHSNFIC